MPGTAVEWMNPGSQMGEVGSRMSGLRFDSGYFRPYVSEKGKYKGQPVVSVMTGKWGMAENKKSGKPERIPEYREVPLAEFYRRGEAPPVSNAFGFRKDQWIEIDQAVYMAARARLTAWSDLVGALSYGNFNAYNRLTLEYYTMDDVGEAVVDMDALTDGRNDRPSQNLRSIPLPITHSDFSFSDRELGISTNGPVRLDTTMAEMAGRRVAEMIEKTVIGIEDSFSFGTVTTGPFPHTGNSQIYGYLNHPGRYVKTDMTVPTGANPQATVNDVIAMRETLIAAQFYGPYMLYYSTDWDQYLDQAYAFTNGSNWATAPAMNLRQAIMQIKGIQDVKRLDYLTPTANNSHRFTMILVQMTRENLDAVNGMDITTMQWESKGGLQKNFKVMAIAVPRIKPRNDSTVGIVHGRTAT